jgi:hypothetical protein
MTQRTQAQEMSEKTKKILTFFPTNLDQSFEVPEYGEEDQENSHVSNIVGLFYQ